MKNPDAMQQSPAASRHSDARASKPHELRVLLMEDSEADAELILRELRRAGFAPRALRTASLQEFGSALSHSPSPDLVLCDYNLQGSSALDALELLQRHGAELPFIVVSGTVGDESAAELIRLGADDYLLKDRLARLGPAVRAALEKHRLRREARRGAEALRRSNRMLAMSSAMGIAVMRTQDPGTLLSEVCRIAVEIGGFRLAWVCLLDRASQGIEPIASAGEGRDLVELICRNSASAAVWSGGAWSELASGRSVVIDDIESSQHYPLRAQVLARGIRSAGFVPCGFQDGRARVLSLYAGESGFFEPEQLRQLERLAGELVFALDSYTRAKQLDRALAELGQSEQRFRQMAENIRDVFFLVETSASRILYVNPAYEQVWGRSCDSLYTDPQSWLASVHPEDREGMLENYRISLAGGGPEYTYRIVRPDCGIRWIQTRTYPIRDATGQLYRVAGLASDVTERKLAADALRESEQRFQDMLGKVKLLSLMLDRDGRITYCNGYLLRLTGWGLDEVLGGDWFELFIPPGQEALKLVFARLLADDPSAWHQESEIVTRSGARRLVRWNNSVLRSAGGEAIGTASIGEDITEQRQAEVRIRRLNRVYAVLSEANTLIERAKDRNELLRDACRIAVERGGFLTAGIGVVDRKTMLLDPMAWAGEAQKIFPAGPFAARRSGQGGRALAGLAVEERRAVVVNDIAGDTREMPRRAELQRYGIRSMAFLPLMAAGEAQGVLFLCAGEIGFFDDEEMRLLNDLARDIGFAIGHLAQAEKLDYLAYFDTLTGLANRAFFVERLAQKILAAGAESRRLGVFVLDIERFRAVNDALGRATGDEVLIQLSERFQRADHDATRLGRIAGDVFCVVAAEIASEHEAARLIERYLAQSFDAPFRVEGQELRLSARAGVAMFPAAGPDAETLLRKAEAALKKAKETGERYLFHTEEMSAHIAERLALESKLRQALEREEFVLHYQPKLDAETASVTGLEALLRWRSPELGLVPPLRFIPLLEETGLILQVGAWALNRAARDHRAWVEQGLKPPRVAVNVSAIQLRQRDFVAVVEKAILDGRAPGAIDLEITESLLMDDVQINIEKLAAVRALGIQIAIDDFGTGYSSLGYLAKLPVHALKIDRSFIITMNRDTNAMTLVSMIISLAHSLRLKVIAEGVETEEQAKFLRLLRCDQMQGYLFSKPLPPEEMTALLVRRKN